MFVFRFLFLCFRAESDDVAECNGEEGQEQDETKYHRTYTTIPWIYTLKRLKNDDNQPVDDDTTTPESKTTPIIHARREIDENEMG